MFKSKNKSFLLFILGFFLITANLRGVLTCVGPLLDTIMIDTGMTETAIGILSSLPLVVFAFCAIFAKLERYFGLEKVILYSLILIAVGASIRPIGGAVTLFVGTLVLSSGIATINVLMPSVIKRDFPQNISRMTTAYTLVLSLSAAFASGVAVPLAEILPGHWRGALEIWVLPAVIAILIWWPAARTSHIPEQKNMLDISPSKTTCWKNALAWRVTGFMGLQSLFFYVAVNWFPVYLGAQKYSAETSGWLITIFQVTATLSSLLVPFLIKRTFDQRWLAFLFSSLVAASLLGLLMAPEQALLWLVIAGAGAGPILLLAFMFIALRTTDYIQAAKLSFMAQSIGYIIAAFGPFLFGFTKELSGGWELPLYALIALIMVQAYLGYKAGKNVTI